MSTASASLPIIRPTLPPFEDVVDQFRSVWESGQITSGRNVAALEEEVCAYTGAPHCVAVGNCTAGLILSLLSLDLAPGEVLVPAFTFAATAHAVVWAGHEPVFVDCQPGTFNADPDSVRASLTPRTRAILVTHIFGVPVDVDELRQIAQDAGISILFDAAQALGAKYRGRGAGSLGDLEVFSMSPTKVVTAAEGGLITLADGERAGKLRRMRDYGKARDGADMEIISLNARQSEFHAVIARSTLRHSDAYIGARRRLIARYQASLASLPGISFQTVPSDRTTSGNYMVVRVGKEAPLSRDSLYQALGNVGIQTKKYFWPVVHLQAAYRKWGEAYRGRLPEAERAAQEGLALPLYGHMTDEECDRVIEEIHRAFSGARP